MIRNRHFFVSDLLIIGLATYMAFILRLENFEFGRDYFWRTFVLLVAAGALILPFIFWQLGLYSRYWRYASVEELLLLAVATGVAALVSGLTASIIASALNWPNLPRSIPFIYLMLLMTGTGSSRLILRLMRGKKNTHPGTRHKQSVAIMGAGDAGAMVVREMQNNPHLGMEIVGFLDDDKSKHHMQIHGVRVLGDRYEIRRLAERNQIDQVIVAMPTAPGKVIRDVVALCKQAGVLAKAIPGIHELLDGSVHFNQIRDVQIEDLLRRDPVTTDVAAVRELLQGKTVLITGGGGSIGSELCRQVLRAKPRALIILGHGENSVFAVQNELTSAAQTYAVELSAMIGDIRFPERMVNIFQQFRPDIVFHAAAHKHVPLMELNPAEAITNNVIGTRNVVNAAIATGVQHFVMISSDKAVNPTSIMGASKRAAELVVRQAAQKTQKPYVAVRFGNVLGSRGSVLHTFKQQIAAGGPVTITHPDMTRYFMTIPEAVQLVLQAAVMGRSGDIFLLDMGEPVKIADLARDLIELSGFQVGQDIEIAYTGIRPGEKLFEELFVQGESYARTQHEKIFSTSQKDTRPLIDLDETLEVLRSAAYREDRASIVKALKRIVPEYTPASEGAWPAAVASVVGNGNENASKLVRVRPTPMANSASADA
jgi:FlaA1/EpsC-like NDP-sugar epimerase